MSVQALPHARDHPSLSSVPLYTAWFGRSYPLCHGRVLLGPNYTTLTINASLIIAVSVLFQIFVADRIHIAVVIVFIPFPIATLYYLFSAALTEPGIIPPRPEDPTLVGDLRRLELQQTNETRIAIGMPPLTSITQLHGQDMHSINIPITDSSVSSGPPDEILAVPSQRVYYTDSRTGAITYNEVPLKYCSTCHIWRPYGTSHCRECNVCVQAFDHHCPWIGNCVGRRNHAYFVAFVFWITAADIFVFIASVVRFSIYAKDNDSSSAISHETIALVLAIFCFVLGWCLVSLSTFHIYLIKEGLTTNSHIKKRQLNSNIISSTLASSTEMLRENCDNFEHVYGNVDAPSRATFRVAFYRFFCQDPTPSLIDLQAPANQQPFQPTHYPQISKRIAQQNV